MPSLAATPAPRTATRSARASWPASNVRPSARWAFTAPNSPGDAARTAIERSAGWVGSCTGAPRTRSPLRATSDRVPAERTPLSRVMRASASHGRTAGMSAPGRSLPAGSTTTSVAARASNRPTIWLPAVLEMPSVATRAAMPSTVPSTVSRARAGRASTPASDSANRSRGDKDDFIVAP